jgi:hypothetical protein
MNLTVIKANMTEVKINGGLTVLFSYNTPVACVWENGQGARTLFKTDKLWSNTTSRHINAWAKNWILSEPIQNQPQEYFTKLVA